MCWYCWEETVRNGFGSKVITENEVLTSVSSPTCDAENITPVTAFTVGSVPFLPGNQMTKKEIASSHMNCMKMRFRPVHWKAIACMKAKVKMTTTNWMVDQ